MWTCGNECIWEEEAWVEAHCIHEHFLHLFNWLQDPDDLLLTPLAETADNAIIENPTVVHVS